MWWWLAGVCLPLDGTRHASLRSTRCDRLSEVFLRLLLAHHQQLPLLSKVYTVEFCSREIHLWSTHTTRIPNSNSNNNNKNVHLPMLLNKIELEHHDGCITSSTQLGLEAMLHSARQLNVTQKKRRTTTAAAGGNFEPPPVSPPSFCLAVQGMRELADGGRIGGSKQAINQRHKQASNQRLILLAKRKINQRHKQKSKINQRHKLASKINQPNCKYYQSKTQANKQSNSLIWKV